MTAAGAESRANYLLKWEAIRHVARAGRHELRPVGPRDRRDRPFQDRVRRSRGPLHRRLGPRARPARATGLRGGPGRSRVVDARGGGPASPGNSTAASFGADRLTGRPRGDPRGAGRLGPPDGRRRRRPRLPVARLGRASRGDGLAGALPHRRRRPSGAGPQPAVGADRRGRGVHPARAGHIGRARRRRRARRRPPGRDRPLAGRRGRGRRLERRRDPGRDRRTGRRCAAAGFRADPRDPAIAPPAVAAARPGHRR